MRRGWPALALCGCFAPAPPTGTPCAAVGVGERCPDGQVCVAHDGVETCESMPGATPADTGPAPDACETCTPDDTDGDGILDIADNCPAVGNVDQTDEDADAAGDACDACPPFAGTADDDGDGLPDACDPNPAQAGDRIVAFVGFASLPADWSATNVTADNGDGIATAAANAGALFLLPRPSAAGLHVWADATLVSIAGTALGAIGVTTALETDTRNVVCQLTGTAAGGTQKLRLFENGGLGLIMEGDHPFTINERYTLRVAQAGSDYSCGVTNPQQGVSGTRDFNPSNPQIGLRVRSATARFHWAMVLASD